MFVNGSVHDIYNDERVNKSTYKLKSMHSNTFDNFIDIVISLYISNIYIPIIYNNFSYILII